MVGVTGEIILTTARLEYTTGQIPLCITALKEVVAVTEGVYEFEVLAIGAHDSPPSVEDSQRITEPVAPDKTSG
jgi:hypothetical protein